VISLRLLFLASVVFIFLLLGHPASFGQDVVGYTAVLQSTNSSEIDGYSLTETSYEASLDAYGLKIGLNRAKAKNLKLP
jgi:hypothetical protein